MREKQRQRDRAGDTETHAVKERGAAMNRIVKQKDETGTLDLPCRLTRQRHGGRDGERARGRNKDGLHQGT